MRNNTSIARQLKEQILVLREDNLSYNKIAQKLKCSKGTINYHLTEGAAEKIKSREGRREWRSIWRFVYERKKKKKPFVLKFSLLRKKGRAFLYGQTRKNQTRRNRMGLKHKTTKIFQCLQNLWPGIKKEKETYQAINQWTGELDYYPDGKPIMTPFARCKLTDEIVNVKGNSVHCDHINGDPSDNSIENFSMVRDWANQVKGDAPNYKILFERNELINKTLEKYRYIWDV